MSSLDGKGRTLFEIIIGRNQKKSLESKYPNPLGAKIGCTVSFNHKPEIAGINFVIEKIAVYDTKVNNKSFCHTDYHLKGISLDHDAPVRLRLRLIPDENIENTLGHRVQILNLYYEMVYDKSFHKNVLGDPTGEFWVNQDDEGMDLEEPRKYWRIEDVVEPYNATLTTLNDFDDDGIIVENELEHQEVVYWDYARLTDDPEGNEISEFLTIEMDKETGYFRFLRGTEILPSQVSVF